MDSSCGYRKSSDEFALYNFLTTRKYYIDAIDGRTKTIDKRLVYWGEDGALRSIWKYGFSTKPIKMIGMLKKYFYFRMNKMVFESVQNTMLSNFKYFKSIRSTRIVFWIKYLERCYANRTPFGKFACISSTALFHLRSTPSLATAAVSFFVRNHSFSFVIYYFIPTTHYYTYRLTDYTDLVSL